MRGERHAVHRRRRLIGLWISIVGLLPGLILIWIFLFKNEPVRGPSPFLMGYILLASMPSVFVLMWRGPEYALPADKQRVLDERLRAHVAWMADRLGMERPASRISASEFYGIYYTDISKRRIVVSVGILDDLAPAEVDFLVAHELAHIKLGHLREREVIFWSPGIAILIMAGAFTAGRILSLPPPVAAAILLPSMFAGMVLYGRYVRRSVNRQITAADRLALEATRNLDAAISAIQKLGLQTPLAEAGDHVPALPNPARDARIQALSAIE